MDGRTLVREFVSAWRRGDADTARRIKKAAWDRHREHPMSDTTLGTLRTIYDVESTIPLGPSWPAQGGTRGVHPPVREGVRRSEEARRPRHD